MQLKFRSVRNHVKCQKHQHKDTRTHSILIRHNQKSCQTLPTQKRKANNSNNSKDNGKQTNNLAPNGGKQQ